MMAAAWWPRTGVTGDGQKAAGIGVYARSKDHRDDLPQVRLPQVVTRMAVAWEGIPVRVRCRPGNAADSALIGHVKDHMRDWTLSKIVRIADHRFSSADNRRCLRKGDHHHHIVGERLRSTALTLRSAISLFSFLGEGILHDMNIAWSIRNYRWVVSILSLSLLAVAVLEGGFVPVVHAASRRSALYRSSPRHAYTEQQSGSVINEGLDRHLKTVSVSDVLDDPTNTEESAEVYPTLQRIGRQEGFTIKVVKASPTIWIRDDFLAMSNGVLLAPSSDSHVEGALKDLAAYRDPPGHVYATGQGRVAGDHEIAAFKSHARENGLVIRDSRVYLEGGNVMVVPKADGSKGVLIGMSSLLVSTFLLNREGAFAPGTSFPDKLKATQRVIAQDLGVDPRQVTYLDQLEFHLDMFLTPGANGQVFIEDPHDSNATVNALIRDPGLSKLQRHELKDKLYSNTALSTLRAELKPTIDELRGAGYQVVGVPGEYNPKPVEDTDFMNGIVATGADGKPYDIVGQSPTTPLNEAFRKAMAHYGIKVFFVPDTQGLIYDNGSIHCVTTEQVKS